MELIIAKKKITRKKAFFKIDISFMIGDADGYNHTSIKINDTPDGQVAVSRLALALECCNAAYPSGMGGYDEYHGLHPYDAFFKEEHVYEVDDYQDLLIARGILESGTDEEHQQCIKEYHKEVWNPMDLYIEHEYSHDGEITTSFDGYSVSHTDNDGRKSDVVMKWDKTELNLVNEAKNLFE